MGLNVDVFGAEDFLCAFDGQTFDDIRILAAPVIPSTGVAFRIFVGEHGAGGFKDGFVSEVFRGNQFKAARLPPFFIFYCSVNLWI